MRDEAYVAHMHVAILDNQGLATLTLRAAHITPSSSVDQLIATMHFIAKVNMIISDLMS